MVVPLVVLAFFAAVGGWLGLPSLLEQARPPGTAEGVADGLLWSTVSMPAEHLSHEFGVHAPVSLVAFFAALAGFALATLYYGVRKLSAERARRALAPVYRLLWNKWWFDELYDFLWVRPALWLSRCAAAIDRQGIDWLADNLGRWTRALSRLDDWIDRLFVDGLVNGLAAWTYRVGLGLRRVQTGRLRQYVMLIVVGTVLLFMLITLWWNYAAAGQ
jgi:NADH-quinone oxidoreductase subunit L